LRRYLIAAALGAMAVIAFQIVLNRTPLADWIVQPMLTSNTDGAADAIVVLGGGVTQACTLNIHSEQRVLLAARLYKQGRAPVVVMTGGAPSGVKCTVASVMADLAREIGVPADRVLVEETSRNTRANAALSAPLLHGRGARRVLIVTDRLHMPRAQACFEEQGFGVERAFVPLFQAYDSNVEMLGYAMYEFGAIRYYRARGWISKDRATGAQ
jgi:uncharacterized SAM-binding protein YcdF (DUF218 family)